MSAQTSYEINQALAYAGQVFANHPHDIDSRAVEDAAGINFGVAVSRGANPDSQITKGGDAVFFGITIRSLGQEGVANTGAIQWDEKEQAGVLRRGYIWLVCPTGCVPGDPANYVDATGIIDSGLAVAGETQLDDAQWETTAAAGELAILKLESTNNT